MDKRQVSATRRNVTRALRLSRRADRKMIGRALDWMSHGMFTAGVESGDRVLAVLIMPDRADFGVMAIETARDTSKGIVGIFDDHGHKVVGVFPSAVLAFREAERFAEEWKVARVKKAWECACKEIPTKKAKRKGAKR